VKAITLHGKKELDIYINPQRQRLLRAMTLLGKPATPKQLSEKLGISASSVQHHLKRLMELSVVELHHTEIIHGITARYYIAPPCTINLGTLEEDGNTDQRIALMQNAVGEVFNGFVRHLKSGFANVTPAEAASGIHGDLSWGVARLTRAEAEELFVLIRRYLEAHEQEQAQGEPWEYALIAYPTEETHDA